MFENITIIMSTEVWLSIVFLGLVFYCINISAFNVSICVLLTMFVAIIGDYSNN